MFGRVMASRALLTILVAFAATSCGGSDPTDPTPVLTSVALSTAVVSLPVGDSVEVTATPRDGDGQALAGITVTWQSANVGVVTATAGLNNTVKLRAVAAGTAVVTATAQQDARQASAPISVTILAAALTSVSVSSSSVTLTVGDSLIVSATPRDATLQAIAGINVTWQSGNLGVVTATAAPGNTVKLRAISAGNTQVTASAQQNATVVTAPVGVTVLSPESVMPLFVLDPCNYADSAAMWGSGHLLVVDQGSNIGNHRPTLDNAVGAVPWNAGCTRAFRHRYNFLNSEAQAAYDWPFAGTIGTTKRVYYKIWIKLSDSVRVARDWKTMFLLVNEVNFANPRYRVSLGHEATSFSEWQNGTINSPIDLGMQLTALPILPSWQERGEIPPKGVGRFQGTNGHLDADAPSMKSIAFTGAWRLLCVYQTTPETPAGPVAMKMWNNGVLMNDSDVSAVLPVFPAADSMHLRFFNKFTFGRNGELFTVNPANEAVIRQTAYVHSGRVEIFNTRPSTGCGP